MIEVPSPEKRDIVFGRRDPKRFRHDRKGLLRILHPTTIAKKGRTVQ